MNSGLRKAHKYIWILLIVIIPVVIFFSVKNLAVFSQKESQIATFKTSKGIVIKTSENEILKASLIKNDSLYSLEVILKKPLKQSSLVLENLKPKGTSEIIGQLSSVGIYKFEVNADIEAIMLRDPLKKEDLNILTVLPL